MWNSGFFVIHTFMNPQETVFNTIARGTLCNRHAIPPIHPVTTYSAANIYMLSKELTNAELNISHEGVNSFVVK